MHRKSMNWGIYSQTRAKFTWMQSQRKQNFLYATKSKSRALKREREELHKRWTQAKNLNSLIYKQKICSTSLHQMGEKMHFPGSHLQCSWKNPFFPHSRHFLKEFLGGLHVYLKLRKNFSTSVTPFLHFKQVRLKMLYKSLPAMTTIFDF